MISLPAAQAARYSARRVCSETCYVPAYLGASGWIGVDLTYGIDWDEINELLDASSDVRPDRAGSPCSTPGHRERDA